MPIDIRELRVDQGGDPERWREFQRKRFKDADLVDRVLELDSEWRALTTWIRDYRKELNTKQKKVLGPLMQKLSKAAREGTEVSAEDQAAADAAQAELAEMRERVPAAESRLAELITGRDKLLEGIGNEVHDSVPVSDTEADNRVEREVGGTPAPELPPGTEALHHHELLWMIGGYEPDRGVAAAGHRAYFLTGAGTQLNIALISYALEFLRKRDYSGVQPPYFLNKEAMGAVAELDDYDEQLYHVSGEKGDSEKYLIATSEQPLCTFHRGDWLNPKDLPVKYAGWSTCFRKEAGSHGRDTWGIFRVHQFEKIEQFVVCAPEDSWRIHEEMIATAEDFYKSLGIAFRVITLVSKELNNAAAKKYDLEGWFPGFSEYRELVSCSNCTDFQARAMETRFGAKTKADNGVKTYAHMLNSTLCATTRTICAILENYQTPDGVKVPEALVPYMGGTTFLPFVRPKPKNLNAEKSAKGKEAAAGKAAKKAAGKAAAGKKEAAPAAAAAAAAAASSEAPKAKAGKAKAGKAKAGKAKAGKPAAGKPAPAAAAAAAKSAPAPAVAGRPSLSTAAGLDTLNAHLAMRTYVSGHVAGGEDAAVFDLLPKAPKAAEHPHAARWYRHIASGAVKLPAAADSALFSA